MNKQKHNNKAELAVIGIAITSLALTAVVLSSSYVSADDSVVDDVSITVPVACSMGGTITTGQEHTATLQPGTYSGASGSDYENGIGKTTLTTMCNDFNGFSIYAIGYTNEEFGNNTLVGTAASNNATIPTKVYQSGDTTSNWSMKVTKVTDSTISYNPNNMTIQNSFNNWHIVPSTYTKVAEYHATTGSSTTDSGAGALGAKVETTYASYISTTQPADTYTGKVKYVMVHPYNEQPLQPQPSTAGCINYHANASDAVGTMGCQSATDNASVTLLASNFSRVGYGFAGWSDAYDYATNPSAHFYGPHETITVPTGTTANGLSLYAVWVKSEGSIQDQSKVASVCNNLTTAPTDGTANLSSVSALTDQRDNNTYAIAKLADGNCWMIENLRLESTAEHNSDGTLAQGYGTSATYGNFGGLANAESANFENVTTANSLYYSVTQEGTASINIGTSGSPGYRMPRYNNWNNQSSSANRPQNPTTNTATNNTTNASMYSYGNYYTWHAAIADTTHYSSGDHNTTSLCPTGWKLPLGNTSTGNIDQGAADTANKVPGFSYLDRKMGGTGASQSTAADSLRWRKFPVNFLYSGYFYSSSADDRGSSGIYWSSTANGISNAYYLGVGSSNVYPGTLVNGKNGGLSIRCVAGS